MDVYQNLSPEGAEGDERTVSGQPVATSLDEAAAKQEARDVLQLYDFAMYGQGLQAGPHAVPAPTSANTVLYTPPSEPGNMHSPAFILIVRAFAPLCCEPCSTLSAARAGAPPRLNASASSGTSQTSATPAAAAVDTRAAGLWSEARDGDPEWNLQFHASAASATTKPYGPRSRANGSAHSATTSELGAEEVPLSPPPTPREASNSTGTAASSRTIPTTSTNDKSASSSTAAAAAADNEASAVTKLKDIVLSRSNQRRMGRRRRFVDLVLLPYYAVAAAVAVVVHQVTALLQLLVSVVQHVLLVLLRLVGRFVLLFLGMVFGAWYNRNRWVVVCKILIAFTFMGRSCRFGHRHTIFRQPRGGWVGVVGGVGRGGWGGRGAGRDWGGWGGVGWGEGRGSVGGGASGSGEEGEDDL